MTRIKSQIVVAAACVALAIGSLLVIGSNDARAQNPNAGTVPVTVVSPLPLPVTLGPREAVQFSTTGSFTEVGAGTIDLVTVPAGKRLVIEHVSARVNDTSGVGLSSCALTLDTVTDFLVCHPMGKDALNNVYAANAQTKFYANAGQTVRFSARPLPGGGTGVLSAFASGYYEPVP